MLTTAGPYCSTSPLKSGSATVGAPLTATVGRGGIRGRHDGGERRGWQHAVGGDTAERERAGDGDRDRAAFEDIRLASFSPGEVAGHPFRLAYKNRNRYLSET